MANSEWALDVQVLNLGLMFNAEIRDGLYCCCDISYIDVPCEPTLEALNTPACTSECEPVYQTRFGTCFADGTCTIMESTFICANNATCASPLFVPFRLIHGSNVSFKKASFQPFYITK